MNHKFIDAQQIMHPQQTFTNSWLDAGYLNALLGKTMIQVHPSQTLVPELNDGFKGAFRIGGSETPQDLTGESLQAWDALETFQRKSLPVATNTTWWLNTILLHDVFNGNQSNAVVTLHNHDLIAHWSARRPITFTDHGDPTLIDLNKIEDTVPTGIVISDPFLKQGLAHLRTNTPTYSHDMYIGHNCYNEVAAVIIDTQTNLRPIMLNHARRFESEIEQASTLAQAQIFISAKETLRTLEAHGYGWIQHTDLEALLDLGYPLESLENTVPRDGFVRVRRKNFRNGNEAPSCTAPTGG